MKAEVGVVKANVKDMKDRMEAEAAEVKQRFEHIEASLASLHTLLIERLPQRSSTVGAASNRPAACTLSLTTYNNLEA